MEHFLYGALFGMAAISGLDLWLHRSWVRKFVADELSKVKTIAISDAKFLEHEGNAICSFCAHPVARWRPTKDGRVACLNCQHDHGV